MVKSLERPNLNSVRAPPGSTIVMPKSKSATSFATAGERPPNRRHPRPTVASDLTYTARFSLTLLFSSPARNSQLPHIFCFTPPFVSEFASSFRS
jgi:hypothetical protein